MVRYKIIPQDKRRKVIYFDTSSMRKSTAILLANRIAKAKKIIVFSVKRVLKR